MRDPRSKEWMFTSPSAVVLILAGYFYFCLVAGPRYMESRKPYDLKNVLFMYNLFQVLYSAFLVCGGAYAMWLKNYNFACEPIDYSESPGAMALLHMSWYYYFGKILEVLDTVFFVLRKKKNQITFLHLYHHSSMIFWIWLGLCFVPAGHPILFGVLNSFVHVLMYTYYLLAGLGPQYQKYLWWKKHMTIIQLVQFVIIFIHNMVPMFTDCTYPKVWNGIISCGALLFIYMFGQFYIQNYRKEKKEKENSENQKLEKDNLYANGKSVTNDKVKTILNKEL